MGREITNIKENREEYKKKRNKEERINPPHFTLYILILFIFLTSLYI